MPPITAGPGPASTTLRRRPELIALAAALIVRLALWTLIPGTRLASDEDGYVPAGLALLASGRQDLFWPPVTGWLVALVAGLTRSTDVAIVRLAWIAMDAACLLLIAALARRAAAALWPGDAARTRRAVGTSAFAYALYLPAISFAEFATSEIPALLQTLSLLALTTTAAPSTARSALAGVLGGTLILTRPSLLPVVVCVPAALALRWPRPLWLRHAAIMLALSGAVVAALLVANWRRTGELTIATNSAYNLYIGNRELYAEDLNLFAPQATPEQIEFRRQYFGGTLPPPALSPAEMQREGLAAIREHPGRFLRRALGRLARVFAPKTDVLELLGGEARAGLFAPAPLLVLAIATLQWAAVLFGGLVGLAWCWRRDRATAAMLASVIAGSLPLCLIAIAKPRYAFPFEPLLIVAAALLWTAPPGAAAQLSRRDRLAVGLCAAFIVWGWAAWLIFAFTSRAALAGPA
jgi:hypothetical protein